MKRSTSAPETDADADRVKFDREGLKGARQLFGYLNRFRGYFIAALCAMAVTGFLVLLFPLLMGDLFGVAIQSSGSGEKIDVAHVLAVHAECDDDVIASEGIGPPLLNGIPDAST